MQQLRAKENLRREAAGVHAMLLGTPVLDVCFRGVAPSRRLLALRYYNHAILKPLPRATAVQFSSKRAAFEMLGVQYT